MLNMSTASAPKQDPLAGCRVDVPAHAAGLRTVVRWHLDQPTTRPLQLVPEHGGEHRPSSVTDGPSEVAAFHPRDVELLYHDGAVALGESCGLNIVRFVQNATREQGVGAPL